jgi:phenylalanyl-tRNA synthetase alpha chain
MRQAVYSSAASDFVAANLKETLEGLARHLFGQVQTRWVDTTFPFTHPSFELEIYFEGNWLEVLGCGVIAHDVLRSGQAGDSIGWAFGLGLECLAMVLFGIPDIRLFWSSDQRFLQQFNESQTMKNLRFQPFSKYPSCHKDVAFWTDSAFSDNSFADIVRNVAGDLVEQVELVDRYLHPKTLRTSFCYRLHYRSMDRSVTNAEINIIHSKLRDELRDLGLELR